MRTNTQQVYKLVPTESAFIDTAIQTANEIVNNRLADKLSEQTLQKIETFLSAHYLVQNPKVRQDLDIELNDADGLKSTNYGRRVLELDTTGTFDNNSNFAFFVT